METRAEKIVENGEHKSKMFTKICALLDSLQEAKGKRYGSSWCKHGEAVSIFGNVARKYDRIEKIIVDYVNKVQDLPSPESEESVAETVSDLAVYCILWLTWISENRPQEFKHWEERIINLISAGELKCILEKSEDSKSK